jgi:hypothetical protein
LLKYKPNKYVQQRVITLFIQPKNDNNLKIITNSFTIFSPQNYVRRKSSPKQRLLWNPFHFILTSGNVHPKFKRMCNVCVCVCVLALERNKEWEREREREIEKREKCVYPILHRTYIPQSTSQLYMGGRYSPLVFQIK